MGYNIVSIPAFILSAYHVYHLCEATDKKIKNNNGIRDILLYLNIFQSGDVPAVNIGS